MLVYVDVDMLCDMICNVYMFKWGCVYNLLYLAWLERPRDVILSMG
jgi:ABC-type long-subunit fatty acid transport system fused permease/ATPase subunit